MMAGKAKTFGDTDTYKKIMKESDPAKIKKFGRLVKNFSEEKWNAVKYDIVKQGNYYKFNQNEDLKEILKNTKNKILVEAAKNDSVWGIGYSESEVNKDNINKWGSNLLGKALMEVRNQI